MAVPSSHAVCGWRPPSRERRVAATGTAASRRPTNDGVEAPVVDRDARSHCASHCLGTAWPSGPTASRATWTQASFHQLSLRSQEVCPHACRCVVAVKVDDHPASMRIACGPAAGMEAAQDRDNTSGKSAMPAAANPWPFTQTSVAPPAGCWQRTCKHSLFVKPASPGSVVRRCNIN